MNAVIDHTRLHRTAKYFIDSGQVETVEAALDVLRGFGFSIHAGAELGQSEAHQIALLTLVNLARRTFLGGVEVTGVSDFPLLVPLVRGGTLSEAVQRLGGSVVTHAGASRPAALIGTCGTGRHTVSWQLTWSGWRGGVIPAREQRRLSEDAGNLLAPAVAAAVCAAELFAWHAREHTMAGRRSAGLSLWRPGADWLVGDPAEPALAYLPSRLWLIGLGNLGQAFAWLLACLPYADRGQVELVLQDFDRIAESNDSTSLLSSIEAVGRKKTREVGAWLEAAGFQTAFEERRFGEWTRRASHEPGVALCGVDNALARAALEDAGFELVVEAGLGAGPQAFRSIALHTFPSSRCAADIWSKQVSDDVPDSMERMPAYQKLKRDGMDACGLTQLASRTVGVPFVGLMAGCLAVSELLRRLNGGYALEFASGSVSALEDLETGVIEAGPYAFGHVPVSENALNSSKPASEVSDYSSRLGISDNPENFGVEGATPQCQISSGDS